MSFGFYHIKPENDYEQEIVRFRLKHKLNCHCELAKQFQKTPPQNFLIRPNSL